MLMDEHIDMNSPLSQAYWCGNSSCSYAELASAVCLLDSTSVGLVGLHLATRRAEPSAIDQVALTVGRWLE